ncbi:EAL domain-containing protein [Butyrivibrio proteoclasticus]|uniref:EAL domain-containing protein n=1 Tax=Butyrivibrio proteoclasticus TaxID=43305 RepID=UPI000686BA23|nr:EAL domain-containing protein [Butyrivibrio proteoclasticus]
MEIFTNPQSYNITFTVSSLALLLVVLLIHLSEEDNYSKQRSNFGCIVFLAIFLNIMALVHNIYIYSTYGRIAISASVNSTCVILEKAATYMLAYFTMKYVMSIFHIEPKSEIRRIVLFAPTAYAMFFMFSGFISEYYFYFSEEGEMEFNYPQGATVNIGVILYFIFSAYLLIKYTRSLSTEKAYVIVAYYFLMLLGIPIRIITKSSSVFEFSVSIALLLCVYTFQNPGEFVDRMSGAKTRTALEFLISNNILQKKEFTLLGIHVDKLSVILGSESIEASTEILEQITSYLKPLCPNEELFHPDQGDFMIIFPGVLPDETIIERTADSIRKRFKDEWHLKDKDIKLLVSLYALAFPDEIDSVDRFNEVKGVIDKALIRQNREILRVTDLNLKIVEHDKKIDAIVKHALEDDLLQVYYQPIYCAESGKFDSAEALLRLKDPNLGFISPAVFMPVAERNGKVIDIDRFVISSVCEMFDTSSARSYGLNFVEVNLSIVDCIQTNLADNILATMKKYNVKSSELNFEITETMDDKLSSVMMDNIDKLRENGVELSIDDFGTGYSNIARATNMPVDLYKLDKSIVQSAFNSETSYMVMFNIIKIIKALKKKIVAEGVETAEQAKQIIKLGCDHIQGFYYARPMPKDQFLKFLQEHNY